MHTIENEELRVMISDHGAELSGSPLTRKTIVRFSGMQTRNIGPTPRAGTFSECRTSL